MSARVKLMYEALKLESLIEYYIEKIKKAYHVAERKVRANPRPNNLWVPTKELLEEALVKLHMVKQLVTKTKTRGSPHYLVDAMDRLSNLYYSIESRRGMPNVKKNVAASVMGILLEVRKLYVKHQEASKSTSRVKTKSQDTIKIV